MPEAIDRLWRLVATAICFALFGLGGLVLRFVAFPLLWLTVRDAQRRQRRARAIIKATMVLFVGVMRTLGVLEVEVRGAERLAGSGSLVLANHPTLIDVVLLMTLVDDAVCIVKGALSANPFTRGPVRMAGYLLNSEGPQLVEEAIAALHAGANLLMFPEGTRSSATGPLRLQRGAANIAVRGAVDITPVLIRCRSRFLTKDTPWWRVPPQRARLRLDVGDAIAVGRFATRDDMAARDARELTRFLEDYFAKELPREST